jgi:hypothetical protein
MVEYFCETCLSLFTQKAQYEAHKNSKQPCKKDNTIEALVEKKVKEVLSKTTVETITPSNTQSKSNLSDHTTKTREELIGICKERKIKGYSGKKKEDIARLLADSNEHHNYNVLSLFTGMGGMDIGFAEQVIVHKNSVNDSFIESNYEVPDFVNLRRLPFDVVFQNDILPEAKKIAELNNWNHNYHLNDIRDMLNENHNFPYADVIIGGFPCQDFSHAGKRMDHSRYRNDRVYHSDLCR